MFMNFFKAMFKVFFFLYINQMYEDLDKGIIELSLKLKYMTSLKDRMI